MRVFELLVFLSLFPSVGGAFVAPGKRPLALILASFAAIFLLLIHIFVEGGRWQMAPAYILAIPLVIDGVKALRRRTATHAGKASTASPGAGRRGRLGPAGMLLFLVVGVLLASLMPVFEVAPPNGDFGVGTVELSISDPARNEAFVDRTDIVRELPLKIWYPADNPREEPRAPYMENPPLFLNHLGLSRTNAREAAPVAGEPESFPVVLFSHGYGGMVQQNTVLMEALASRGYVVVSVGHPFEALVTVYPDGRTVSLARERVEALGEEIARLSLAEIEAAGSPEEKRRLLLQFLDGAELVRESLGIWREDLRFALDEVEKLHRRPGRRFSGRLDLDRIAVLGHSIGGAASAELAIADPRVKAGIHMYGIPLGGAVRDSFERPFMYFTSTEQAGLVDPLIDRARGPFYRVAIRGTARMSFTDLPLWLAGWGAAGFLGSAEPERVAEIVEAYTTAFLDTHLRGREDDLLSDEKDRFPGAVVTISNRTAVAQ